MCETSAGYDRVEQLITITRGPRAKVEHLGSVLLLICLRVIRDSYIMTGDFFALGAIEMTSTIDPRMDP